MTHYYTNNIDLKSQKTQISFQYRGHHLIFISDSGVFSKERIDYGSRVLLESMISSKNIIGCWLWLWDFRYFFKESLSMVTC